MKVTVLYVVLFFALIYPSRGQQFKASLEIEFIPKIKDCKVDGRVILNDSIFIFRPEDLRLFKTISLPLEDISGINFSERIKDRLIVRTNSDSYTLLSNDSKKIFQKLCREKHLEITGNSVDRNQRAFFLNKYAFIFPVLLDYSFPGTLSYNENYLIFNPEWRRDLLNEIIIPKAEINKMKVSGYYWLLLPRNILKVKTQTRTYRFMMDNPKEVVEFLKQ